MSSLTSLSYAHPAVPLAARASLSLPGPRLREAHDRLREAGLEAFLLSTCLRVELVWTAGPEQAPDLLTCLYGNHAIFSRGTIRTDGDAFLHLSRVAGGLDSPLVGEPEVLAQFRQAVSVWRKTSGTSPALGRVLEAAIGLGRHARRRLGQSAAGSLAGLAAERAAPLGRVAIFGSGAMARAAAERLVGIEVVIFARRPTVANGHRALPWDQAPRAMATYPVVISAVPGKNPLFGEEVVARALAGRRHPLLLIDLGMPPGFPLAGTRDAVDLVTIDDLAGSVQARPPSPVETALSKEADTAWARLSVPDRAGGLIAAILERADLAVTEEVRRFAGRFSEAEDPERVLRQLAHTVARRVLHSPISYLGAAGPDAPGLEVVAEAFGVENG